MFYWTPASRRRPLPAVPVSLPVASGSFLNFNQPEVHCCVLGGGGDGQARVLLGVTGCACQSSIERGRCAAHRWLLGGFFGGTCPPSLPSLPPSHVAVSPFIIRLRRRTQAAQSISALPFSFDRPPPSSFSSGQPLPAFHLSALRWMQASSFSAGLQHLHARHRVRFVGVICRFSA